MSTIILYTEPGLTSLYLGEVEIGEYNAMAVTITGKNTTQHHLRHITIALDGVGAPLVQLAAQTGVQVTWAQPGESILAAEQLEPEGEFAFNARVLAPEDGDPGSRKFEFVVRSKSVG